MTDIQQQAEMWQAVIRSAAAYVARLETDDAETATLRIALYQDAAADIWQRLKDDHGLVDATCEAVALELEVLSGAGFDFLGIDSKKGKCPICDGCMYLDAWWKDYPPCSCQTGETIDPCPAHGYEWALGCVACMTSLAGVQLGSDYLRQLGIDTGAKVE